MDKNKNLVNYQLNVDAKRKRLFNKAKQLEPWYSPHHTRNVFIVSILLTASLFYSPLSDIYYAFKNTVRLHIERKKFLKELDREEALSNNENK